MGGNLVLVLVVIVALASAGRAAVYHVDDGSPSAADSNAGDSAKPFKTISHAASIVVAGDRVVIHTGVYREEVHIKTSGSEPQPIVFEVAPAAHVVVTGADVLADLKREPGDANIYSAPWPHRFIAWNKSGTHPDDPYHEVIGRCEQVIVQDYLLRQVIKRDQLARGTFYVDLDAKRIYVWDGGDRKLAGEWGAPLVEASVRSAIWVVDGANVQTRGIRFRYAANMAQHGAVVLNGAHDVLEDCVSDRANAAGAVFASAGIVVRRCAFRDNGQQGFSASNAHELLMSECLVENNNIKGYDRGWEAGGNKLALCRGAVLEKSRFVRNHGNGVWFDIGNENCTVRNCLIADNEGAGIFYEISYGLHATDNVIIGNGFLHDPGAWGANGGISISSSPDRVIERNILMGNREGFQFREAPRTTIRIGQKWGDPETAVWNHDSTISHNIVAWNRDFQIGGWFDTDVSFHWPKAMQEEAKKSLAGKPPADIAAAYKAAEKGGRPAEMTLEGLNLKVADNIFAVSDRQQACQWGTSWRYHKTYQTADEAASRLPNFSGNSQPALSFADVDRLDLRVPAGDSAVLACYPKGEVPGVVLGSIQK